MNELGFWILRYNNQVLITTAGGNIVENIFPYGRASDFCDTRNVLLAGEWSGLPCYTADIDQPPKQPFEFIAVRRLFGLTGAEAFALAGRATQLLDWQNNHQYCGKFGSIPSSSIIATTMKN
jgi:NAD+ diphosphatase